MGSWKRKRFHDDGHHKPQRPVQVDHAIRLDDQLSADRYLLRQGGVRDAEEPNQRGKGCTIPTQKSLKIFAKRLSTKRSRKGEGWRECERNVLNNELVLIDTLYY